MAGVLEGYHAGDNISAAVAGRLTDALRRYLFVGGMPEAVQAYADRASLVDVQRIQSSIVATMEDDFAKYGSRAQQDLLRLALKPVRNGSRRCSSTAVWPTACAVCRWCRSMGC